MKHLQYLFIILFISSCGNEKTIQLAEISHSKIQEVLDVSPAYIFYDETKPDSLELNRKNLISTTNWLVNVDKRLMLHQAIPQIMFLQDKKENSNHKKEGVKNYFTCNDTSIKNLGFIEFTNINYKTKEEETAFKENTSIFDLTVSINSMDAILIQSYLPETVHTSNTIIKDLLSTLQTIKSVNNLELNSSDFTVNLRFNKNLTFQEYITIKSLFSDLNSEGPSVSNNEYIY
ncbi:hypothetical protein KO494_07890 [Lacinutrix sp. C3R15]|uniref:hypothetical protein n=1 Tax=Flavobacteriaceae TaxID=49546 RepID=UPI001C09A715|nr:MULTISPECIES: hypothetical protein [Flavobacteriaceae]MBU2939459.1 hypothetical protein [Lacinutrix sp. C3R15]MDO6622774.1 hypothetical protein [Oceanihabitans sp. 1_MG-2023]